MQFDSEFSLVIVVDSNPLVVAGLDAVLSHRRGFMAVGGSTDPVGRVSAAPSAPAGPKTRIVMIDPMDAGVPIRMIAAANPDVSLVAYVPVSNTAEGLQCIAAGFRGVLSKASSTATVFGALQLVAQGGMYIDAPFTSAAARPVSRPEKMDLSEREISVLRGLAKGMSAKEIGQSLKLSGKTIETYKARAATKLHLKGRREMVDFALRSGIITAEA
jgi:DNA-binding NarL/FixJ family response regulator